MLSMGASYLIIFIEILSEYNNGALNKPSGSKLTTLLHHHKATTAVLNKG